MFCTRDSRVQPLHCMVYPKYQPEQPRNTEPGVVPKLLLNVVTKKKDNKEGSCPGGSWKKEGIQNLSCWAFYSITQSLSKVFWITFQCIREFLNFSRWAFFHDMEKEILRLRNIFKLKITVHLTLVYLPSPKFSRPPCQLAVRFLKASMNLAGENYLQRHIFHLSIMKRFPK